MFGAKTQNDSRSSSTNSSSLSPNSINSLVAGTTVDGTIMATNDIRIDGKLTGKLECKGRVIIGANGSVRGEIICQNAVIEGHFDGNLKVKDNLEVKDTAKITGDVDVNKLNVSAGALFNVNCNMGGGTVKEMAKVDKKRTEPSVKIAN